MTAKPIPFLRQRIEEVDECLPKTNAYYLLCGYFPRYSLSVAAALLTILFSFIVTSSALSAESADALHPHHLHHHGNPPDNHSGATHPVHAPVSRTLYRSVVGFAACSVLCLMSCTLLFRLMGGTVVQRIDQGEVLSDLVLGDAVKRAPRFLLDESCAMARVKAVAGLLLLGEVGKWVSSPVLLCLAVCAWIGFLVSKRL